MNEEDAVQIHRILLDRVRVYSQVVLSGHVLEELRFTLMPMRDFGNVIADDLLAHLETEVLVHKHPPEHITDTKTVIRHEPTTWWDHWKQDHQFSKGPLGWLARKLGYNMTTHRTNVRFDVELTKAHAYPEAPPIKGFGKAVHTHFIETEITEKDMLY